MESIWSCSFFSRWSMSDRNCAFVGGAWVSVTGVVGFFGPCLQPVADTRSKVMPTANTVQTLLMFMLRHATHENYSVETVHSQKLRDDRFCFCSPLKIHANIP